MGDELQKAFELQVQDAAAKALDGLSTDVAVMNAARDRMRVQWAKLCEAEGVEPTTLKTLETLEISDSNRANAKQYAIAVKAYMMAVRDVKASCKQAGVSFADLLSDATKERIKRKLPELTEFIDSTAKTEPPKRRRRKAPVTN